MIYFYRFLPNRIIGVVDTVALKLVLGEQTETLLSTSLALSVKPADGANFQETVFSIADPNTVQVCVLFYWSGWSG